MKVFKNDTAPELTTPKKLKREELCELSTSELIVYWRTHYPLMSSYLVFLDKYVFGTVRLTKKEEHDKVVKRELAEQAKKLAERL